MQLSFWSEAIASPTGLQESHTELIFQSHFTDHLRAKVNTQLQVSHHQEADLQSPVAILSILVSAKQPLVTQLKTVMAHYLAQISHIVHLLERDLWSRGGISRALQRHLPQRNFQTMVAMTRPSTQPT